MPWQDRIQPASYTSPSGSEFPFLYEDVKLSVKKKTSAFTFPGGDGTYVQDLGHNGFRYAMQLIFSGDDHDTVADAFLDALLEVGVGKLQHPIYGTINVVPFGDISRRDDLKSAANQSIFQVTFFETVEEVFPTSQQDVAAEVVAAIAAFNEQASEKFGDDLVINNEGERQSFKNKFLALLDGVTGALDLITQAEKSTNQLVNNISDSINGAIDILIAQPALLAFQLVALLQAPGRMVGSLNARVSGYKNLIDGLIGGSSSTIGSNNDFQTSDLYASGSLIAYIDTVVNAKFTTKSEALLIAEDVLNTLSEIEAWREANYTNLGLIDSSGQYAAMQSAAALTAGFLVQLSFSLLQERRIILDRDRSIIDLTAELYGSVDDKLDFFIDTNELSGDEYIQIKKGREVVYFV